MTEKTETDKKTAKDANKTVIKNEKAAAKSDMKTEERDRQTVTVTTIEAAIVTAAAAKANIKMKRVTNSESRKNIKLLTVIQMMLRVLLIF